MTVIFFIQFLIRLLAGPLLPAIENDLSLSHSQSGVFILLIGAGIFISQLFAPYIASWKGYRCSILMSLSGASISALVIGFSESMWVLNSGYFLLGFTGGLYTPSGISLITVLVDTRDWGKAMGIHEIAPSLALISAPVIATVTVGMGSWRTGYLYVAIVLMILLIFYILQGPDSAERPYKPDIAALKRLVVNPSSWKAIALLSIAVGIETGVYSMTPLFLVNERNFSLVDANHLLSLSRIPGLLMVMLSGWLSDRLSVSAMVRTTFLLTGVSVVFLGCCPRNSLETIIFIQAAFSACMFPPLLSMISKITTSANRAIMISLTIAAAPIIGGGFFPALIAFLGDYGSFSGGFVLTGALSIAGILFIPHTEEMQT